MIHPLLRGLPPVIVAALLSIVAVPVAAQQVCPAAGEPDAEAGWQAYQAGDIATARERFEAALAACPDLLYAVTGLGYVELRVGEDARAREVLLGVVAADPTIVDAQVGLGIEAWRRADLEEVAARFTRVLELDPGNTTALDYLGRLPEGLGPPPDRPPLERPDTITYPSRVAGSRIEVRTSNGWEPFYIKGVNLGAAIPGRNPSEFPDLATYRTWIAQIARMGANVVRVYTIHPPRFYDAVAEWNLENPSMPLWLIHGVWTELPPDDDYLGEEFEGEFFGEMERVVDVVHGRADLRPRPGHASGFYTSDVSDWTVAWIIGREWEPFSAMAFDSIAPEFTAWDGEYVSLDAGNPMEAWLTRALDHMVAYETGTYGEQRPAAYTNWPTLDPMSHPSETTAEEEVAIRRGLGEQVESVPREYDNDIIGLDATRMTASDEFAAGLFASFHAYPYYPDFMILEESYREAASSFGPSNYFGYLQQLKAAHPGMPVVVSEYGVPASIGSAHLQPQGQHHGGLSEAEMARIDRRLTLELAEAGMAGGVLFAWIDEWFKKNWLTIEFELPPERNRLWYNRLDAEQHYGIFAMEPEPPVPGATIEERADGWAEIPPLYETDTGTVRAAHDAAYLWLHVETPGHEPGDRIMLGIDLVDPGAGDVRWPGGEGPEVPVGLEFVVIEGEEGLRVLADPPMNPFDLVPVGESTRATSGVQPEIADSPAGFFRDRLRQARNAPWISEPNDDGLYDSLRVISNRRRFARDSTEYLAMGYDRGVLPGGAMPDGFWEREGDVLEVRIPWLLVNVTDPSSRSVLASPEAERSGVRRTADGGVRLRDGTILRRDAVVADVGTRTVEDIGIVVAREGVDGRWRQWPREGESVARFGWPTWEVEDIRWRARERPAFGAMQDAFRVLDSMPLPVFTAPEISAMPDTIREVDPEPAPAIEPAPDPEGPRDRLDAVRAEGERAWNEGDQEAARRAYERLLSAEPDNEIALHRLALLHAWDDETETALGYFDRLLATNPDNVAARVDRARALAWAGRETEAVAALDELLAERPRYAPAMKARAQFLAWAGEFDRALQGYDELVSGMDADRPIRQERAKVLAWAERYEESLSSWDSLVVAAPQDVETRVGRAAARTFAGDIDGAEEDYRRALEIDSTNVEALQGLARAQSWDGRLVAGEATYRRAVAFDDGSAAALVGLAQNLRWQGRNAAALEILERARRLEPGNADVREQLQWVRVNTSPRARLSQATEEDSDGNDMRTTTLTAEFNPVPRLSVRTDLYRRDVDAPGLEREALGARVTGTWQMEPGWSLSLGGGLSENDGVGDDRIPSWRASISTPARYALTGSVAVGASALDGTAALADLGVEVRQLEVDAAWANSAGLRVSAAGGVADFRGSEPNRRTSGSLGIRQRLGPAWTTGVIVRAFAFEKDLGDGYFDPDFFGLVEASLGWSVELGSWTLRLEGAPGVQRVGSEGDAAGAIRTSGRLAWRAAPGRELWVSGGWSSAGLQRLSATGGADYRYEVLSAGVSWVF